LFTFGLIKPQPEVIGVVETPARGVTVEWGKYVASHQSTCADCHSPVDLSTGTFYSDSAFTGGNFPFGQKGPGTPVDLPTFAYGPNLTPDEETGASAWSEEEFLLTVRTGTRPDGRVLTDHMPYAYVGMWPEEDLRAVYLFLRSLPPVHKKVPPTEFRPDFTDTTGPKRGEAIFTTYCDLCHGKNGSGAPPTSLVLADLAQTIGDEDLKAFISQGQLSLRMPSFAKTLSEEQIADVVAFIRTLKKDAADM